MSRSRPTHLSRSMLAAASLLVALAAVVPAAGAAPVASAPRDAPPKLAYVLSTRDVAPQLFAQVPLSAEQQKRLRGIAFSLNMRYRWMWKAADPANAHDASLATWRAPITAAGGYDAAVDSAEASGYAEIAGFLGEAKTRELKAAVERVWKADAEKHQYIAAVEGIRTQSVQAAVAPLGFTIYATQFDILDPLKRPTPTDGTTITADEWRWQVALPDYCAKWANVGKTYAGYAPGVYAVSLAYAGKAIPSVRVWDCGPWNIDDNWWNADRDPVRPRRIYSHLAGGTQLPGLAIGLPEAQAAYQSGYNGGLDAYGRKPANPAGIDLGVDAYYDSANRKTVFRSPYANSVPAKLGLAFEENAWITVTPLWEARLDLVGGLKVTDPNGVVATGPYLTGQRLTFTYTVKNLGSMAGTWDAFAMTVRTPKGVYENPPFQGPVTLAPGQTKTFSFTATLDATGTMTCFPQARRAGTWTHIGTPSVSLPNVAQRTVGRVGGGTRYETAVALSRETFPTTAKAVLIATGLDFPDALAGGALAYVRGGPLLLVSDSVPSAVDAEIKRLKPSSIVILGGTNAVSANVATHLASVAPGATVTRIGGHNRYATARLIAEAVVGHTGGTPPSGTAIVATGRAFPDALAGSVLSGDKHWPILLTEPTSLPTDTAAALTSIGVTNTIVIGGDKAVSSAVESSLPKPLRIAGEDRYATSAAVADFAERNYLSYDYVGLAVGTSFPDALAGGVLAAKRWGTMLLTPPTGLPSGVRYRLQRHRTQTTVLQAYGSKSVLPDVVLGQAEDALR
jgi:putative cell wall-binding protein